VTDAATDLPALLAAARSALTGVPRERLGALIPARRVLGITRQPRISPVGDAWHLGVLLVGEEELWATGDILRAREGAPRGFTAESQRERAALAAAAFRGGFREGETVHVGQSAIDVAAVQRGVASGPLLVQDGVVTVRWSAAGNPRALGAYVDEHIALLREPPRGAT
jgi:hypothetical protein